MTSAGLLSFVVFFANSVNPPGARETAQRFLDAIKRGDERAVCRYMTPQARGELIQGERDYDKRVHTCTQAARKIPRALGRYPILKIEEQAAGHLVVWVDDSEISDSGADNFGLTRWGRGW